MAASENCTDTVIEFVNNMLLGYKLPVHIRQVSIQARHRRISRNGREVLSGQGKEQERQFPGCISWNDVECRVDWKEIAMRPCDDAWIALSTNNNAWTGY